MKFLDQLASTILQKEFSPQHLFVILPSERAKKYLSNALFKLNSGPLISPQIYTIDQWVVRLCDKRIAHPTQVLLMLYGVYQELVQEQALTFDDYLSWGPIMLSDFDDIDNSTDLDDFADVDDFDALTDFDNFADVDDFDYFGDLDDLTDFDDFAEVEVFNVVC